MSKPRVKVLLVEDSPSDALLIQHSLLHDSPNVFEVAAAGRLDEALAQIRAGQFDVVLLDLGLPDCTGIDTLVRASAAAPQMPIVVLTGANDPAISMEAIRRGGQDYLVKGHADGYIVANAIRHAVERKQAEEELKSLNEDLERRVAERTAVAEHRATQLRQLAAELTLAEQRERRRLALILHDGLQQTLVAAKINLSRIERSKNARQATEEVADLIDEAIEISRSLTAELSPPMLHYGGFVSSLKWLARWFGDRHGLNVNLTVPENLEPAPEEVIVLLFQSIRELLFNVVKHAGVKAARVEIIQQGGRIHVSIEDEGVGFHPSHLRAEGGMSGGFGLFSISERLNFLGGRMEIHSTPGKGSRFDLVIPYSAADTGPSPNAAKTSQARTRAGTTGAEKKTRVLLVAGHLLVRQGLAGLIATEQDMEVVGEASDTESTGSVGQETRPDLVLFDIDVPGMNRVEAVRTIRQKFPGVRMIGLSMFELDDQTIRDVGLDYVARSGQTDAIIAAIRACARGSAHMSRGGVP